MVDAQGQLHIRAPPLEFFKPQLKLGSEISDH